MKVKFLFSTLLVALLLASCGKKEKEIRLDPDFSSHNFMKHLVEITSETGTLSCVEEKAGEVSVQTWTIEVPVRVIDDHFKGAPISELKNILELNDIEANVRDEPGSVIKGMEHYKITDEDADAFFSLLSKGKGAEGIIRYTHTTHNHKDKDEWFKSAASADLIGWTEGTKNSEPLISTPDSSSSSDLSSDSDDDSDFEENDIELENQMVLDEYGF